MDYREEQAHIAASVQIVRAAKEIWSDIKTSFDFKLGLSLFLAIIAALAVLRFL